MLELFLFETTNQLEQLEQAIIDAEQQAVYEKTTIDEVFRIMHTIKGSAAMMLLENVATIAHRIEDLFYYIREDKPVKINTSQINDLVLEVIDCIKEELDCMKQGVTTYPNNSLMNKISDVLKEIKQEDEATCLQGEQHTPHYYVSPTKTQKEQAENHFQIKVHFKDVDGMESIRAFTIAHHLKEICEEIEYTPEDLIQDEGSSLMIREQGFFISIKSFKGYEEIENFFDHVPHIKQIEITQIQEEICEKIQQQTYPLIQEREVKVPELKNQEKEKIQTIGGVGSGQGVINVSIKKLDKLMDLVGEMVTAESMVTQNPDLRGLSLENFDKSARALKKITSELRDTVMSIRMVPLGPTFSKMNRIVRDMSKKLGKQVHLEIIGEETEVDKNIIEHIGDPLMHLVRNAVDHGLEEMKEREKTNKSIQGNIILEAKNAGNEVIILIKDDGKGLDEEKIIEKAIKNGVIEENHHLTSEQVFQLILLPGFSTKEAVTEFSGRGVGMDVVAKSIEKIGGSIQVQSQKGEGTTIVLKIPLTLAIVDAMNVKVGKANYTIPITGIKESFRPKEKDIFKDPQGNEMIGIRGGYYKIVRLHKFFQIETSITHIEEGILMMLEQDGKGVCIFADELVGEQQVVVKPLPTYIRKMKKIKGIGGCTLLGDGGISLILDIQGLIG
jgi:two-component system chemotaxis sensor kinase CheA